MPVANCSRSLSCDDCLGARDPYCGWCSLDRTYELPICTIFPDLFTYRVGQKTGPLFEVHNFFYIMT